MPPLVQGLGGAFLYANNVETLAAWYSEHLGLEFQNWGKVRGVQWPSADIQPNGRESSTIFALFQAEKPLPEGVRTGRVNLRVDDLDVVVRRFQAAGIAVEQPQSPEYGRFAWVNDPEGNRLELWEPSKLESPTS